MHGHLGQIYEYALHKQRANSFQNNGEERRNI